jgi:nitrous oxidase accessory protein
VLHALLASVLLVAQTPPMSVTSAAAAEGRQEAGQRSPLQTRIDQAAPGSLIEVAGGTYEGDLYLDRPVRLIGKGRPRLVGSGTGSVVRVRADDVTIEGFDIDGREGGSLSSDSSGIHIAARRATVRDCRIVRSLFGVYLLAADDARVERVVIEGVQGKAPGDGDQGIHPEHPRVHARRQHDSPHATVSTCRLRRAALAARNVVSDVRTACTTCFPTATSSTTTCLNGRCRRRPDVLKRLTFRRNRFLHIGASRPSACC